MVNKKEKPTHAEIIAADNLLEEAREVFEKCITCGMCKSLCPVFAVLKEESLSPRGHSILISEKLLNESLFKCNLCRACEEKCPLNLKVCEGVLKGREALVLKGKGLKENKEMIANVKNHGNPFGKDGKWGGDCDKLYCC